MGAYCRLGTVVLVCETLRCGPKFNNKYTQRTGTLTRPLEWPPLSHSIHWSFVPNRRAREPVWVQIAYGVPTAVAAARFVQGPERAGNRPLGRRHHAGPKELLFIPLPRHTPPGCLASYLQTNWTD